MQSGEVFLLLNKGIAKSSVPNFVTRILWSELYDLSVYSIEVDIPRNTC